jgi:hypothetical protein
MSCITYFLLKLYSIVLHPVANSILPSISNQQVLNYVKICEGRPYLLQLVQFVQLWEEQLRPVLPLVSFDHAIKHALYLEPPFPLRLLLQVAFFSTAP